MLHSSLGRFVAALWCVAALRTAAAQQPPDWDANRTQMSRAALNDLLQRLDASANSSAYSSATRAHARAEAAAVRTRLTEGDLRLGDRIYLHVDGEPALADTFTVGPGKVLTLPIVGDVPLAGVLHAELEGHLHDAIGKYVKDPVVHVRSLIRLSVLGEVNRPGFYIFSTQTLVSDVLMMAGGPTHEAKTSEVRIMRGNDRIWEGAALQQAIADGKTLDQLSLTGGDEIDVPKQGKILSGGTLAIFSALIALPGAIYGIIQLFK